MVKVELAIYDLSRGMCASLSQQFLGQRIEGIWHTGVVIFGVEWYFGGGIQCLQAGAFSAQNSIQVIQLLDMGESTKSRADLESFLRTIRPRFTMDTYDLINNNCNNFSDVVCNFLIGRGIPTHIVDLPRIVFSTPAGQMFRPMIESMQQNIRQQNHPSGIDPFSSSSHSCRSSTFECSLANGVQSVLASHVPQCTKTATTTREQFVATLDSKPLVSNDRGNVAILGKKLLNLSGSDGVPGSLLSSQQKSEIETLIASLSSIPSDLIAVDNTVYPPAAFSLLEYLIESQPSAQMSCLFLMRLMVLQPRGSYKQHFTIDAIVARTIASSASARSAESPNVFTSDAARVMALCTLANMLTHTAGRSALLAGTCTVRSPYPSSLVDLALQGMCESRLEIRLMSSALAYNLTLAFSQAKGCSKEQGMFWGLDEDTYEKACEGLQPTSHVELGSNVCASASHLSHEMEAAGAHSHVSIDITAVNTDRSCVDNNVDSSVTDGDSETKCAGSCEMDVELCPVAVQLLLGCLEGLDSEPDKTIRHRKLTIICRLLRSCGEPAARLTADLGGMDVLQALGSCGQAEVCELDKAIIRELCCSLNALS